MPDEPKSPTPPGEAHAAPPKPAGPASIPWDSTLVSSLKQRHGSGIAEASSYLGQNYLVVDASIVSDVLTTLRDQHKFNYCVDITAVHYPQREKQFDLIWILYSFDHNQRIRVKTLLADGEAAPSVVSIWPTANWLEREVFDMFGIKFDGHPDLKRILLPDGWKGHPLRKDYGIIQQDNEWVQINLGIESGQ